VNLRLLSLAETDLMDGFHFYECNAPNVGSYFLESLFSDIESLRLYAGYHRKSAGFYRALSRRFPYVIYYRLTTTEIQVWRVLDGRRDPAWIKRQLKKHRKS
jgi:plasmid stabilization system protein ParE